MVGDGRTVIPRLAALVHRDRAVCAICNWLLNRVASERYRGMIGGSIRYGLRAAANDEWTDGGGMLIPQRDSVLPLRPQIASFAALMEREMVANAHKDDHPLSHDFDHLLSELRGHVAKFEAAPTSEHAADIANLAMLALAEIAPAESGDGLDRLPGAASGAAGREQYV